MGSDHDKNYTATFITEFYMTYQKSVLEMEQ